MILSCIYQMHNTCIKCWPRLLNWCVLWRVYNENGIFTIRQEKSQIHDCCPRRESCGVTKESFEAQVGPRLRPGVWEETLQKGPSQAKAWRQDCVVWLNVWHLWTDQGVKPQGKIGGWSGQSLCLIMDSSGSCKWTISLSILDHPWSSPSPRMLLSQLGFPRTLSRTCIITLCGHKCLTIARPPPPKSLFHRRW